MTKLHSAFNFQQWIIESDFQEYKDFEYLFDGLEDNRAPNQTTATNLGIQHYYTNDEIAPVANVLRKRANEILKEQNAPVHCGDIDHGWAITYGPGGWQALHSHSYRYNIISTILYFDTNESENTSNGALYSILSEPDGDQLVSVFPYWAGKFILMEGAVFHGAYPTTTTRRALIIDFKQEINDEPNT